ncbi:MAG: sigma-54-dependent Fis family transcriptional regulator [Phycisphaerales bacterium]|nr:sigma-54-dependent Fis family transcriptional regulator [Phycisphaerales bacterium]
MAKILVIEDEENLRYSIKRTLAKAGHAVFDADRVAPALSIATAQEPDVVITDLNLHGGDDGLDIVKRLRAEGQSAAVIVITAYGSVETAVEAIKQGADEFLQKPLSMEELKVVVGRVLENRKVRSRLDLYERIERSSRGEKEMLGASPAWRKTVELAQRLAQLPVKSGTEPTTILLLGETGVGKGMLARFIHESSAEANEPFVHVNCSALPANLIEGELFGHEKGAFTDARESRQGLFELADGGTIFLDEIGDMPIELQSKLLIVVEQGTFRRVGGSTERRVNMRILAATNHDLKERAERDEFRRDLFYRLSGLTIPIPALRDRQGDALLIAESLLAAAARKFHRDRLHFSAEAKRAVEAHNWPGNVRELANAIQRAALLAEGDAVQPHDLALGSTRIPGAAPEAGGSAASGPAARVEDLTFDFDHGSFTAEGVEERLIREALRHARGNVSRAAKLLDMNRSSLRYRIERYKLDEFIQEVSAT